MWMAEHPERRPADPAAMENVETRARTDRGNLGDKVPVADPATAPLGTDAETGGAHAAPAPAPDLGTPARHPRGQAAGEVPTRGYAMSGAVWGLVGAAVLGAIILLAAGVF
jgi:hypothetical protein